MFDMMVGLMTIHRITIYHDNRKTILLSTEVALPFSLSLIVVDEAPEQ